MLTSRRTICIIFVFIYIVSITGSFLNSHTRNRDVRVFEEKVLSSGTSSTPRTKRKKKFDIAYERGQWARFAPNGRTFADCDNSERYLTFGKRWYEKYKQLVDYKKITGNCDVPELHAENPSLGHWVHNQRKEYSKGENGSITSDRIEALNELSFQWELRSSREVKVEFERRYSELLVFKESMGHVDVPQTYKENLGLARWVNQVRIRYKKGQLEPTEISSLEGIGFTWSFFDKVWNDKFTALCEYKEVNGDCNIPSDYKNQSLVFWVKTQRKEKSKYEKCMKSSLTEKRIKLLDHIGFEWSPRRKARRVSPKSKESKFQALWGKRYEELISYKRLNENFRVPVRYQPNPALGRWTARQRRIYRQFKEGKQVETSEILKERIERLEEIGFGIDL